MSNKCNEYLFTREHNECIDAYVMYTERRQLCYFCIFFLSVKIQIGL